jgi:hypothetical protein
MTTTKKAPAKKAPTKTLKPSAERAPIGRAPVGPNAASAKKYAGKRFRVMKGAKTARKEKTVGRAAFDWLAANPGATADQIANAGNFMQHIEWDLRKNGTVELVEEAASTK